MHLLHLLAAGAGTRKAVSMQPGAVPACVSTLQRAYSAAPAEHAAGMLHALAEAGKRAEIVQAGGVEALTLVLRGGSAAAKTRAVHALSSLAEESVSHSALAGSALGAIVEQAGGADEAAAKAAIRTLNRLAVGGNAAALSALASSEATVGWLVVQLGGSRMEQAAALSSLRELSASPEAQQILVGAGGVAALVAAARSTADDPQSQAAVALVP